MKLVRIAFSIYIGLLFSFIFTILFSEAGLNQYKELSIYKTSLSKNIEELKKINVALSVELDSLKHDKETIRIYSRDLGLYEKNEKIIKITGYSPQKSFYDIGKLIKKVIIGVDYSQFLRIIGLLIPLAIFILSFFITKMMKRDDHKANRSRII